MILKHNNWKYSGIIPLFVGDRRYGQDMVRDYWSIMSSIGESIKGLVGSETFLLKGGIVSQGSSYTQIDITELTAIIKTSVEIPDSFSTTPPSKTTGNVSIPLYLVAQSNISLSSATLNGSTTNYVKATYNFVDGNTRTRVKKPGSYAYEGQSSVNITINSTAPTQYELQLATLVGNGSSFLTITNGEFPKDLKKISVDNISESSSGNGVVIDGVILKDAKINTGHGANELYPMDQDVKTTASPTFAKINTGHGANELYPMNQNVKTTASPTFAKINTGHGANELYPMNQNVRTTTSPTFADILITGVGAIKSILLNSVAWLNQSVKTTASPTFANINVGKITYSRRLITSANFLHGPYLANVIFAKLKPFIPNIGDIMEINGGIGRANTLYVVSQVERISTTTAYIHVLRNQSTPNAYPTPIGDLYTTPYQVSLTW